MELVSVIIPVYNAEKWIQRGLDSIINQTYKKIEIIIIDDASSDSSPSICLEYARRDARVRFLENTVNLGAGPTRNKGLSIAQGKYITFFDADDFCEPFMIEKAYAKAKEYDADLVVWGMSKICMTDSINYRLISAPDFCDSVCSDHKSVREKWKELRFVAKNAFMSSPVNKLYKTQSIKSNQVLFPETRRLQDAIFNVFYIEYVETMIVISEAMYYYMYNDTNMVLWGKLKQDIFDDVVFYGKCLESLMKNWGDIDEKLKRFMDNDFYGLIFLALDACRNPKWNYNIINKYKYIKKCLKNEYLVERSKNMRVTNPEFIKPSDLIKKQAPIRLLFYIYTKYPLLRIKNFLRKMMPKSYNGIKRILASS